LEEPNAVSPEHIARTRNQIDAGCNNFIIFPYRPPVLA
jgi:hypothetical protein